MTGRKTKLTPEVQEKIVKAIEDGNFDFIAAEAAGISKRTFFRWLARGEAESERLGKSGARPRKSERPFWHFWHAIKKAHATAESIRVRIINNASEKNWQAAAWWLERKHSDRWSRKEKRELSGPDGGPIRTEDAGLTDKERLSQIFAIIDGEEETED